MQHDPKGQEALDRLAFDFFREFARCEYSLKVAGFLREKPYLSADWHAFADAVKHVFNSPPSERVKGAINYYLENPPKKQIVRNGLLDWSEANPYSKNQAELVLRLVGQTRNNLFHGGKFNNHWFAPQRSEKLLKNGLIILRAVIKEHPKVREAYDGRASLSA